MIRIFRLELEASNVNDNNPLETDIVFWSDDYDSYITMELRYKTEVVGLENATGKIAIKQNNEAAIVKDLEIIDKNNGIVRYTFPRDQVEKAGNGIAQVRLSFADGSALGFPLFKFKIQQSLFTFDA